VKSNSEHCFETGATTTTTIAIDEDTTMLRDRSPLPDDGCVIPMTNGGLLGPVEKSDDEDEMSETAALTALIKGCVVESQL